MSILILSNLRDTATPYHEWLASRDDVHLFCTENRPIATNFYKSIIEFVRYEDDEAVERAAIELNQRSPLTAIIARAESDILRAAAIRQRLGIEGQHLASAFAYRNKIDMKNHFLKAGIRCAAFASVGSSQDIYDFTVQHGYPVVIKPTDGSGGKDTYIVHNREDLANCLQNGIPPNIMIESFINGDMFHVDAFVVDGKLIAHAVSKYVNSALSFQVQQAWGSYVIPKCGRDAADLVSLTQRLVDALPTPKFTVVHAEIWRTPDGEFIPCEIASRTGGSLIARNIRAAYGFDLNELWIKAQAGMPWEPLLADAHEMNDIKGFVIVPPKAGVMAAVDISRHPQDVDELRIEAPIGLPIAAAQKQADCLASIMTTQKTELIMECRLKELGHWVESRITWQDL